MTVDIRRIWACICAGINGAVVYKLFPIGNDVREPFKLWGYWQCCACICAGWSTLSIQWARKPAVRCGGALQWTGRPRRRQMAPCSSWRRRSSGAERAPGPRFCARRHRRIAGPFRPSRTLFGPPGRGRRWKCPDSRYATRRSSGPTFRSFSWNNSPKNSFSRPSHYYLIELGSRFHWLLSFDLISFIKRRKKNPIEAIEPMNSTMNQSNMNQWPFFMEPSQPGRSCNPDPLNQIQWCSCQTCGADRGGTGRGKPHRVGWRTPPRRGGWVRSGGPRTGRRWRVSSRNTWRIPVRDCCALPPNCPR